MSLFRAIDTAVSGATFSRTWMDAISDNVANVNTVRPAGEEPFRSRLVVARSVRGRDGDRQGVEAERIALREGEAGLLFDPNNPLADENGLVTQPLVDLSEEMTNLILANRSYQANLAVIDRVRDSYQAALRIGNG